MSYLETEMKSLLDRGLPFDKYRNKTFMITGATGLIGSLLVKSLLFLNKSENLNLKVVAVVRNQEKARIVYKDYEGSALYFTRVNFGVEPVIYNEGVDYIVHCASVTTSKLMISQPVETIITAVNGTEDILRFAKEKKASIIYISSMEVYGQIDTGDKVKETQLGYIDLFNPRSCYPESKRMCEILCTAYASEYDLDVKMARLAQTFGVGIMPEENRVFAQFARSVINREDIVLHTDGSSEGNYVYTIDAIAAILLLLTEGVAGEAYNISNEECHMTIKDMALLVKDKIANNEINVVIDHPNDNMGYAPDVKLFLDSSKIMKLGWKAEIDLEEAYKRMINWMTQS